jgi:hypothetical protein
MTYKILVIITMIIIIVLVFLVSFLEINKDSKAHHWITTKNPGFLAF